MKKIFFLVATFCVAVNMSAQDLGFDGRDGTLGAQIYADGNEANSLIQDLDNITLVETDATAHKYEIKITKGGECSFTMGGVSFWYSNSNDLTVAYKSYGTYIQPNGNKRKITIPVVANHAIKIGVPDAIEVAAEGASTATLNLSAWGEDKSVLNTIVPANGATEIVIWSDLRDENYTVKKIKLGAVIYEVNTAISNTTFAPKAQKIMENGQLVILRDGVKYNALGAVID